MARAYTVATAALAINVPAKWIDNVLSHFTIPGVEQARQGIRRRLTEEALLILELAHELNDNLATPLAASVRIAETLLRSGRYPISDHTLLAANVETLRQTLAVRLAAAVEVAPIPRRGRPPKRTGRLD